RVQDELLAEQEQPGQTPGLEDAALAVLPAHHDAALERRPPAITPLAQAVNQAVLLPRIQHQPRRGRQLNSLPAGRRLVLRNQADPRRLHAPKGHAPFLRCSRRFCSSSNASPASSGAASFPSSVSVARNCACSIDAAAGRMFGSLNRRARSRALAASAPSTCQRFRSASTAFTRSLRRAATATSLK